jgi:hypothetical protein
MRAAARIIYGTETDDEVWRKLGSWDFKLITAGQAGKIAFALFSPTIEKTIDNLSQLINTFFTGMECKTEKIEENKAKVTILHDPYPLYYFMGMIEEAIRYFHHQPQVSADTIPPDDHVYSIDWSKKLEQAEAENKSPNE